MAMPISSGEARAAFAPLSASPGLRSRCRAAPTAWRCFTSWRARVPKARSRERSRCSRSITGFARVRAKKPRWWRGWLQASASLMLSSPGHATNDKAEVCKSGHDKARYDLMAAYCQANDIPALVTAHHLDDQAETFLMRLKRGSGLDGLAAIPEESMWSGVAVLRPLLDIPKARLAATLTEAGITWVEDPSNRDQRFERARMRGCGDALGKLGLTPEALARSAQAAQAGAGGARSRGG